MSGLTLDVHTSLSRHRHWHTQRVSDMVKEAMKKNAMTAMGSRKMA